MLGEGQWIRAVDDRGRFPFPAEIIDIFGSRGTWAIEPSGWIVLYPTRIWEKDVLPKVEDLQQFRAVWRPQDEKMDPYGRLTIPLHFRGELGRKILLRSMDTYLKVRPENGRNPERRTKTSPEMKPFQSERKAEEYLSKGKEVVYIGYQGRRVVGKFVDRAGSFFNFVGKDENGIMVPVKEPYWKFYLERRKKSGRYSERNQGNSGGAGEGKKGNSL